MAAAITAATAPLLVLIERENGRQAAELEALRKHANAPADSGSTIVEPWVPVAPIPVPLPARLRALAPWLLAVLVIGVVVVLLAWPR